MRKTWSRARTSTAAEWDGQPDSLTIKGGGDWDCRLHPSWTNRSAESSVVTASPPVD